MLDLNCNVDFPIIKEKELEFFKTNVLSNWTFNSYIENEQTKTRNPVKRDKLLNKYRENINYINQYIEDNDVKAYIESLVEDLNNKVETNHDRKRKIDDLQPSSPKDYEPLFHDLYETEECEEKIIIEKNVNINVWDAWRKILSLIQQDKSISKYSLDHINVIQLGNRIGSKITRNYYSKSLIEEIDVIFQEIPCSFTKDNEFYCNIFDTIALSDNTKSIEVLTDAASTVLKSNNKFMKFFHVLIQSFVNGLYTDDCEVYENEMSYNHFILYPILTELARSINMTRFKLGETKLKAVSQELQLLNYDYHHFYNADGIIVSKETQLEIAILETTGPLNQINDPKETQDYIKAGYGLVAMLHTIGRKFYYGDLDIFKKIGTFFIQATPTKIRIWRLFMPSSKIYIINCIGSVQVPTQAATSEEDLRKLTNLFWLLRKLLTESYQAINELQLSHADNMKIKARKLEGYENVRTLSENFKLNTVVKLPQTYIKKPANIQMNTVGARFSAA